ncbi:MAG: hypothetical protein M3Y56_05035 [Armatimonadota bacterium]|nr:hypothetical protein [Armatimonadota bacterium]
MDISREVQDELDDALGCEQQENIDFERAIWDRHLRDGKPYLGGGNVPPEAAFLLMYMRELSEKYHSSPWSSGLEFSLWSLREGGPERFGLGIVRADECLCLRQLSEIAGGWWMWSEDKGDRVFVPLEEWKAVHSKKTPA